MANEIRIQPTSEWLTPGESVTVPVVVRLERDLKVRGIHGQFRGAEETQAVYTTTSTDSKGNTTTQTHTATEHVEITTQATLLAGNQRMGFFGNLSDAVATVFGGGQHDTYEPGEYDFEIELQIPADAAATHDGKNTRVFYELSVSIDVPAAFDVKATQSFQVAPRAVELSDVVPVRTCYPADKGRGLIDSIFSPDVRIEMALAANAARLGESIDGIFTIESEKAFNCRAIRARLIGIESSEAHGHHDSYTYIEPAIEIGVPIEIVGSTTKEFSLSAETAAPLTASGEHFSIDWFVQVELDVPWAKDPKIRAPIKLLPRP